MRGEATVKKALTAVAVALALAGCSAKSVEVSGAPTSDPTADAATSDVALDECASQLKSIYNQAIASMKPVVVGAETNDAQVYSQVKVIVGTAQARLLVQKSSCAASAPECVDPGAELVDYYTASLDNLEQLSRSAYGGGPAAVTVPVGAEPVLSCR